MEQIYYYEGNYKYQLAIQYKIQMPFKPPSNIFQKYLHLNVIRERLYSFDADGMLTFNVGYAWDGPSGPTFDTADSMRGSMVHDVGCEMVNEGLLPHSYRRLFDQVFLSILIEDGMLDFRAHAWYKAVRLQGELKLGKPLGLKVAPVPPSYPKQDRFGMA